MYLVVRIAGVMRVSGLVLLLVACVGAEPASVPSQPAPSSTEAPATSASTSGIEPSTTTTEKPPTPSPADNDVAGSLVLLLTIASSLEAGAIGLQL